MFYTVVVGHLGMEHMKDGTNIPIVSSYELLSQEALVDHLLYVSLIRILMGRIKGMWADKTNTRAMGATLNPTLINSSSCFFAVIQQPGNAV